MSTNKKISDMQTSELMKQKGTLTTLMELYDYDLKAVNAELSKRVPEILGSKKTEAEVKDK